MSIGWESKKVEWRAVETSRTTFEVRSFGWSGPMGSVIAKLEYKCWLIQEHAQLIAAAPDYHEAVHDLLANFDEHVSKGYPMQLTEKTVAALRDAYRKANGGTP